MFERKNEASGIESISFQTLSGLSYRPGFAGVWTIVGAVLGIIGYIAGMAANPFSILGAISVIITLVMGLKLAKSKKELDTFIHSKASIDLEIVFDGLRYYFRIQGIMIILAIVFVEITLVAMATMGNLMMDCMNSL